MSKSLLDDFGKSFTDFVRDLSIDYGYMLIHAATEEKGAGKEFSHLVQQLSSAQLESLHRFVMRVVDLTLH